MDGGAAGRLLIEFVGGIMPFESVRTWITLRHKGARWITRDAGDLREKQNNIKRY